MSQSREPAPPWTIRRFEEVPSTNDTILEAAARGEPSWTVHLAERQTRGRGRAGRAWWSPGGGGLWMSLLLRPRIAGGRLGGLALVTGVAVRQALESLGSRGIEVHWPNDLYFQGRKLGGILCEARSPGGAPDPAVAVGIGVNLEAAGAAPPSGLAGAVAFLAETGAGRRSPEEAAAAVLGRLRPLVEALERGVPIPELVRGAIAGISRPARVCPPGEEPWKGLVAGIGEDGELLVLRDGGGTEAVRSAAVEYL